MFASAWDIQAADDGGFVIAGRAFDEGVANSLAYIMKVDSAGVLQWATGFGGDRNNDGLAVQPAGDGGYLLAGMVNGTLGFGREPVGDPGILIAKADAAGNAVWSRSIEISGLDVAYGLCVNPDGSFLVAGLTEGRGLNFVDALLMKFDAARLSEDGEVRWTGRHGRSLVSGTAYAVTVGADGNVALVGDDADRGFYLITTDAGQFAGNGGGEGGRRRWLYE